MRRWLLGVALGWLCSGAAARAEPPRVYLEWTRPLASTCPPRAVLEQDVEAAIGAPVFTARQEARVIVRGRADGAAARGVHVRLEAIDIDGAHLGARDLFAPRGQCASLRGAIAFVLTLFVEQHGSAPSPEPVVVGLGVTGGVASTPLPGPAPSVGPVFLLEPTPALALEAAAMYWPATSARTGGGQGASLEAVSLDLRACLRAWAGVGLGLCGLLQGGAVVASPLSLEGPSHQVRLLALSGVQLRWQLRLGRLAVDLSGGPVLALARPPFSYLSAEGQRVPVYRSDLLGASLRIGVIMLAD